MVDYIREMLLRYEFTGEGSYQDLWASVLAYAAVILFILLLCAIVYIFLKKVLFRLVRLYVNKSKNKWDDILVEKGVLNRLARLVPAIIIYLFAPAFPAQQAYIERFAFAFLILMALLALYPVLDGIEAIYRRHEISKVRPIKGFMQVIKIVMTVVGTVLILAVIMDKSPWVLLSGIGVFSAVLLLIFQNSILGFVAGVQLTGNDMVRVGDWIEMPKYNADGYVIDITLHTVKVQNWDKTITMIPTHALISDSFKNWRGMSESGGRRIKRSIYIDMTSIKFCTEDMLKRFESINYLTDYIRRKRQEIDEYNKAHGIDPDILVNGRRMTNIGTFRAYVQEYLKNHPKLRKDMMLLVRQLDPGPNGLPLEIYAFTSDTAWVNYEGIQSDIFDHILAVVPQFDLRIFQHPSGEDLKLLTDLRPPRDHHPAGSPSENRQ